MTTREERLHALKRGERMRAELLAWSEGRDDLGEGVEVPHGPADEVLEVNGSVADLMQLDERRRRPVADLLGKGVRGMLGHAESVGRARTLGTHNLHDAAGVPTFFADAVLFTEAVPKSIRAKARAARARARARVLGGYTVRVCKKQRDLVVALKRRQYEVTGVRYHLVHLGRAEVSPHRGIFVVETIERATGRRVVFIVEHRINAAFPPYVRGEGPWRSERWQMHTAAAIHIIDDYLADGWDVRAGGDLNTPHGLVEGYRGHLNEVGNGLDRLGSSSPLRNFERLGRRGSDHPRIRAVMG